MKVMKILKGIFFVIVLLYCIFTFLFNSIFEIGDEIFVNDGREKLLYLCCVILIVYFIYLIGKKLKLKNLDIQYIREIPNYYSVSVIAFLYNKKIDSKSLLMTTILKLYDLNLITISKQDGKVIYQANDFKNIDQVSKSERYILEWILAENKGEYSYKQLLDIITDELNDNKLVDEKNQMNTIFVLLGIAIFPILQILGYISYETYDYLLLFGMIFLFLFLLKFYFRPSINKVYNKKGLKEHYNVLGFYNFLKDFTLLSKRQMEEYPLWKEYLQYAVLFGVNKNYILREELNILTFDELMGVFEQLGEER